MYPFQNKIALVTGSGSGIGRATAHAFAKNQATVIVASLLPDEVKTVVQEIESEGGNAVPVIFDARKPESIDVLFQTVQTKFGRLDFAVNNAGVEGAPTSILKQTLEDYSQVMDVNVRAVWLCLRAELLMMAAQKSGAIVKLSSIFGLIAPARRNLYCASKHAVLGLTKSLALEFASRNIRINAVCPGGVDTPLLQRSVGDKMEDLKKAHPIGRISAPEEIAQAILWLCSDLASFTLGHGLVLDGGISLI